MITYKQMWLLLAMALPLFFTRCTKFETGNDFEPGDPPPIGNYVNSSEVAPADLVAYWPFDGSINDAKGGVTGGAITGTAGFTAGKKGQAYQGATNSFISYNTAGPLANLTSFTVSMWINTHKSMKGVPRAYLQYPGQTAVSGVTFLW